MKKRYYYRLDSGVLKGFSGLIWVANPIHQGDEILMTDTEGFKREFKVDVVRHKLEYDGKKFTQITQLKISVCGSA